MSDDPQLSGKIEALTQDAVFEDGAMVLGPAGAPETTQAMLRSIDMTMLPRDMVFAVGTSFVTLAVSGKRVRHVADTSPDLMAEGLVGQPVNIDETDAVQSLATVLRALFAVEGVLTVKRQTASTALDAGTAGLGQQDLSKVLGPAPVAVAGSVSTLMGDLYEVLGGYAQIADGAITPVKGDADLAAALEALGPKWAAVSQAHMRLRGTAADSIVTLDGVLPGGSLAHFVSLKGAQVVMATAEGSLPEVALAWARAAR